MQKLLILLLAFLSMSESFLHVKIHATPLANTKLSLRPQQSMTKHNFMDFADKLTVADKYFLIHAMINHVKLQKEQLLFHYCHKNLNYTDVAHVTISPDIKDILSKNCHTKTTLELYDMITENATHNTNINVYTIRDIIPE